MKSILIILLALMCAVGAAAMHEDPIYEKGSGYSGRSDRDAYGNTYTDNKIINTYRGTGDVGYGDNYGRNAPLYYDYSDDSYRSYYDTKYYDPHDSRYDSKSRYFRDTYVDHKGNVQYPKRVTTYGKDDDRDRRRTTYRVQRVEVFTIEREDDYERNYERRLKMTRYDS